MASHLPKAIEIVLYQSHGTENSISLREITEAMRWLELQPLEAYISPTKDILML